MSVSTFILRLLAKRMFKKIQTNKRLSEQKQHSIFKQIIARGKNSVFAKKFNIKNGVTYAQFCNKVKLSEYEDLKAYISRISNGEKNILTAGSPLYFAITSGTTSGTKYIPLTKEMMGIQTRAIKELLLLYAYQKNYYDISGGGMMFIQGSPELKYLNKIPFAKLSGISARHVPWFLKRNRFPSMKTNHIKPWGEKVKMIAKETIGKDLRLIGGIPPWVITYFDEVLKKTGAQNIKHIFPGLKLYIHGGTNFAPYRNTFLNLCDNVDTLEVYPASEGFFAYQDDIDDSSLLLLTNHGVFYEFIRSSDFAANKIYRIPLEGVELNTDYVMLVSTISGLWAYNTGDTIRFVSKNPYKIKFSGRAKQYCSAFGEHVIEKEIQTALNKALSVFGGSISEFTVAPKITPKPARHEWFIEFRDAPANLSDFEKLLNTEMELQNIYYKDLVSSGVIAPLKMFVVKEGGFNEYMKSIGKFGGQNKCPHLSNNRIIVDFLFQNYV